MSGGSPLRRRVRLDDTSTPPGTQALTIAGIHHSDVRTFTNALIYPPEP